MAEREYLISVAAHGLTASRSEQKKDLLDAVETARRWQREGVDRISIILDALPETMQAEYRETFGV